MRFRLLILVLLAVPAMAPVLAPVLAQVSILSTMPEPANPLAGPLVSDPMAGAAPTSLSLMQSNEKLGDEKFQPEVGQAGKDVIWVPTPDSLVKAMLTVANVKPEDYVVDLGSGDGKIAIAAGRDFGARAHGIEYNPDMVALARRNALKANVANKVTFQQGDIFATDFSDATVVTLYLLPSLNLKLRDTLLKMKPGTRIVSHAFSMGDWEPERTITTDEATGYYWVVPAKVGGRWAFEIGNDRFIADLDQQYQKLTTGKGSPLRDGAVKGTEIRLTRADGRVLEGQIRGGQILGRGWVASRIQTAP